MKANPHVAAQATAVQQVSPAFKKEAIRAVVSIIGFIAVYFFLISLSLGLIALCCYAGVMIIAFKAGFYTIIIGAGIVGFGVMVFVFLVKFLFATTKVDESDSIQITAEDHPHLFDMVYTLASEVGTSKPKKIFLSADVNASVSYNSSFWSMFLPIRKNLRIGLGLVNTVNVSELKAVIAHEFGHFSQKSMKVGSWVYQVNRIIYDMLFNNQGYANSLDAASRSSNIIAFFVQMTIKVVNGIQWVLQGMYAVVNKSYLGLSRQMEFHADLVAASICGSNNIISALKRAELGSVSYDSTLQVCGELWDDKKIVSNFYSNHKITIAKIAASSDIELENGLPIIGNGNTSVQHKVVIKDQWASHPSIDERESFLKPFSLLSEVDTTPAWSLFSEDEHWQQQLTKMLYRNLPLEEKKEVVDESSFEAIVERQAARVRFPKVFKNFYSSRSVGAFDVEAAARQPFKRIAFDELFGSEAIALPQAISALEDDIANLKAIINKVLSVKSFDFEGQKYQAKEASTLVTELENDLEEKKSLLLSLDQEIFRFFYNTLPLAEAEGLKRQWQEYFDYQLIADSYHEKVNEMMNPLGAIYRGETISSQTIEAIISNLKEAQEPWFKTFIKEFLQRSSPDTNTSLNNKLLQFLTSDYQYFSDNHFFDTELEDLNNLVQEIWASIGSELHTKFKNITETQAGSLYTHSTVPMVV